MDLAELELFHYVLERGHPRYDVFGSAGDGFEETDCVFLAIEADYKCFQR